MDEKNVQTEEGVSLVDIVKLLFSKIKLLILVVIIGGILGGSFAIWRTHNINYYGTTVEFYINPEKPKDVANGNNSQYGVYGAYGRHVMDNMVRLLNSESFAEYILLEGEMMPKNAADWANEEEYPRLNEKLQEAKAAKVEEKMQTLENLEIKRVEEISRLSQSEENLNIVWYDLYSEGAVNSPSFDLEEYEEKGIATSADVKYEKAKAAYNKMKAAEAIRAQTDIDIKNAEQALESAQAIVNEALNAWRETEKYKATLPRYTSAMRFAFLKNNEDMDDAQNLARSFIYVYVSVLNDEKFAQEVLNDVKEFVPVYVKANMTVPSDYQGTNCQRITRQDDIRLTNPGYTKNQAIKYGLLAGALALIVACIVVVMVDKSDKRLRDTEVIARKFNVPLLGVVPSIEEMRVETNDKKKSDKEAK